MSDSWSKGSDAGWKKAEQIARESSTVKAAKAAINDLDKRAETAKREAKKAGNIDEVEQWIGYQRGLDAVFGFLTRKPEQYGFGKGGKR